MAEAIRNLGPLISEPYGHASALAAVAPLREDLAQVGTELIEYPFAQATRYPGGVQMLVANMTDIHALARAVAKVIVASGEPPANHGNSAA